MRILVVDDEVELAEAVARGLRREGYAVDLAHDGEEALTKAELTPYDLVCLDLTMPGMAGHAVLRGAVPECGPEDHPHAVRVGVVADLGRHGAG